MHNSSNQPVLSVKNVSKSFGGVEALRDGSFDLFPGEVLAIVGSNGAGKSTLIKMLSGAYLPDKGKIMISGKEVSRQDHNVAFMQKSGIFFVDEKTMRKKTQEVLDKLNVKTVQDLTQPISSMSGGQQQSIAIGRAIAWGSKVVILDEPTAALGPNETAEVERLVEDVRDQQGTSFILISHNLDQVRRLADRIVVTHHGVTSKEFKRDEITSDRLVKAITLGE